MRSGRISRLLVAIDGTRDAARWRSLVLGTAIQIAGAVAGFAIILTLARLKGPQGQGVFSSVKAEIDFFTAMLLLGANQSLFYFVRRGEISVRQAVLVTRGLALVAALIMLSWGVVQSAFSENSTATLPYLLTIAGVVTCAVFYGGLRGTVLARCSVERFSYISALPNLLLLMLVAVGLLLGLGIGESRANTAAIFLAAYLVATGAVLFAVESDSCRRSASIKPNAVIRLVRYGLAAWLPAVCQSASVLFAIRWLEYHAASSAVIGIFTAAVAIVTMALMPLNLVAPLLFREWTGLQEKSRRAEFLYLAMGVTGFAGLLGGLFYYCGDWIVSNVLGADYARELPAFQVMVLAILPQYMSKLWGVLYSAGGRPGIAVIVELVRLLLIAGGIMVAGERLSHVVVAWVFAEYLTMVFGYIVMYYVSPILAHSGKTRIDSAIDSRGA